MTAPVETDERRGMPSASSFYRYRQCAGSWTLEQEAKKLGQSWNPHNKDTDKGTRIHSYLSNPDSIKLEGEEINDALFLKSRAEEQVTRIFGQSKGDLHELREKRLFLKELTEHWRGNLDLSAQFDRVVYNEEIVLIQNYKTGWVEPEHPKANGQTEVETLLVAIAVMKFCKPKRYIYQFVTAQFGVLETEINYERLAKIYEDVTGTLSAIIDMRAPLSPHPDVCGKCPAQLICQAVKNQIGPMTRLQISALPLEPKKAAALLDAVSILYPHLDAIWEFYQANMEKEPAFLNAMNKQGYDIRPGNERREFTDIARARAILSEFIEKEKMQIWSSSISVYEDLYSKATKLKGKDLKESFNQLMNGCIKIHRNKSSMERVRGTPAITKLPQ